MSRVEASNAISYKGTVSVEIVTNGNKSNKVIKNTGTDDSIVKFHQIFKEE